MIYCYARVSTRHQSLQRQIRNLKTAYPDSILVTEEFTGTKISRPLFDKLLNRLKPTDTLVFDSVSRMSRDAQSGFQLYQNLFQKGVEVVFLKEPAISTTTYKKAMDRAVPMTNSSVDYILEGINRYLLELAKEQIELAFLQAEKEVSDLKTRTKETLLSLRLNGVKLGRRKGSSFVSKKELASKEIIKKYSKSFNGTLPDKDVIRLCGVCRKSYYLYKKELLEAH